MLDGWPQHDPVYRNRESGLDRVDRINMVVRMVRMVRIDEM